MKTTLLEQGSVARQVSELEKGPMGEEDKKKLRRIGHVLRSDEIVRLCEAICDNKGLSEVLVQDLRQIMQNESCEPSDVSEFLQYVEQNEGVFDMSDFLSGPRGNLLDRQLLSKDVLKYYELLERCLPQLVKWSGKSGGKTDDGDGERALAILIKGAAKVQGDACGDVELKKVGTLEVKGKASRLSDNSNAAVSSVREEIKKLLRRCGHSVTDRDFKNNGAYAWNFNKKGLGKFNKDVKSLDLDAAEIVRTILKSGFTRFNDNVIEAFLSEQVVDNQIVNVARFLMRFGQLEYEHYTMGDKFDKVLFINPDNLNFKMIENSERFYSELERGTIRQGCSLNWATGRDFSQQYTLR